MKFQKKSRKDQNIEQRNRISAEKNPICGKESTCDEYFTNILALVINYLHAPPLSSKYRDLLLQNKLCIYQRKSG